jgi:hypothetical protein
LTLKTPRLLLHAFAVSLSVAALSALPACAQEGKDVPSWAFEYKPDAFTPDALLDLRSLNERVAGESGFVRLTPDGNGFALGNGKPVRFWAVGSDVYHGTPEEIARHVRFLAKHGVNMVRLHTQIAPDLAGSKITDVNQTEIDGIWRFVAAAKREGIYVTISPYWANEKMAAKWGLDGYGDKAGLWGLLFFNPKLQEGYKAWVKALYAPVNPYTGIPLAKDPAVAIIQVQNEDSLLFWTTQALKPQQQAILGKQFGDWLITKYGSLDKAKAAWDGVGNEKDDFAHGIVGLNLVWPMTQPQTGGMAKRVRDEVEFYAETQRKFYADITRYYRDTLGCKQLINASNWKTADPVKLGDTERWTYTATDVLAVNRYTGGAHLGDNNGWRIDPGHHFTNDSNLLNAPAIPVTLKQTVGHPMIVTESTWVTPELYQAEGPFLVAAYESLTGVDTFYWFSATAPEYEMNPYFDFLNFPGGQHAMQKWTCSTPTLMGGFPAAALIYRGGYLKQGQPVVHEERTLDDLWERRTPLISEEQGFDPNRDTGNPRTQGSGRQGVDPLAFLVGPVEERFGGDPAKTTVANLAPYIDREKKIVRSDTGEVRLNYGTGVCVINAPAAQGACGFLSKAGEIKLSDVTLNSGNEYAAVYVVSMDGRPLKSSGKVLVQVGTTARPTGWQAKPADFPSDDKKTTLHGYEVVNTGKMPYQIANTDVTLTVHNPTLKKATLLDPAGYPLKQLTGAVGAGITLKLPSNAMYVILE